MGKSGDGGGGVWLAGCSGLFVSVKSRLSTNTTKYCTKALFLAQQRTSLAYVGTNARNSVAVFP